MHYLDPALSHLKGAQRQEWHSGMYVCIEMSNEFVLQITIGLLMSMAVTKVTWQGAGNALKNPLLVIVTEGQTCKASSSKP